MMDFSTERLSYEKDQLMDSELPDTPKDLFTQWIQSAIENKAVEPYAMSLATCGDDRLPSVRTVLMREVVDKGNGCFSIVFYSNYDSNKGVDLAENPNAEVLFFWHKLERQVRLNGSIEKLSLEKSTHYFHKRPKESQIAAWVSEPQSGSVESREAMEAKFQQLKAQYASHESVPKPSYWGGYELMVDEIEFWQGRANRMHDRILYQRQDKPFENQLYWQKKRLLP